MSILKRIHIYDIDETLVNSKHRYRNLPSGSIDLPYWIKNATPEKIAMDSLLPLAEQYKADILDPSIYVVIATARYCQDADYDYVKRELGWPDYFISRKANDNRADSVLKVLGLRRLRSLRQFAQLAACFWDDNPLNIKAVQSELGIKSALV